MVVDDTAVRGFNIIMFRGSFQDNRLPYCKSFGFTLAQGSVHVNVYSRNLMCYQLVGVPSPTGRPGPRRQSS